MCYNSKSEACEPLEIETGPVTHAEIRTAIKQWRDNRANESRS